MQIEIVDPARDPDWDRLVATHPDSTVFHRGAWAKVLSQTYRHKPFYLRCSDRSETVALIPIMEVRSVLTGRRGVCLPFTDLCRPLTFGDCDSEFLIDRLTRMAVERNWKYFEVRGRVSLTPEEPAVAFYGHSLNLCSGLDGLFAGFDSSVRRAIRKAERHGLSVRVVRSKEAVLTFYRLHVQTRKRHGLPPQPIAFFLNLHREIIEPGLGFVVLADNDAGPVAAAVFLHFGEKAVYKYGASDDRQQELRPNNLVMWHGIRFLAESGCETLHFGRTSFHNDGLRRFKLGWGASEETIQYFRYDAAGGVRPPARDKAAGIHNVVFRNLPSGLNCLAGAIIYPHLD